MKNFGLMLASGNAAVGAVALAFVSLSGSPATAQVCEATPESRGNRCIAEISEGFAAVRLPAAGMNIDDIAAAGDLTDHRWGFLDRDGTLAISPRFTAVKTFADGLAPASEGDGWGYVDRSGEWAIEPDFDNAEPFAEIGVAPVRSSSDWVLVGRDGELLDTDLGENIVSLSVGRGDPAPVEATYGPVYTRSDGEEVVLPEDVEIVDVLGGSDGEHFVVKSDGYHGVVDSDLNWALRPLYQYIDPPRSGDGLWIASESSGYQAAITADGTVIGENFRQVRALTEDFWLAIDNDGTGLVLDRDGTTLATISREHEGLIGPEGPFLIDRSGDPTRVFTPDGGDEPVVLDEGSDAGRAVEGALLVIRGADDRVAGLVSRDGAYISATRNDWLDRVHSIEIQGGSYWLNDERGKRVNILSPDLQPVLSAEMNAKASGYGIEVVQRVDRDEGAVPLAILSQTYCRCEEEGTGLLLSDGRLVVKKEWLKVTLLEEDPVAVAESRYAIATAGGVGMIDEQGNVLIEPTLDHIGRFQNGYATAYGDGTVRVVDREGKFHDIPDGFGLEMIAPGLLAYRDTAAGGALVNLFDVAKGQPVGEPRFESVEPFAGEHAIASNADGRFGVIDRRGEWVLQPRYGEVEPINEDLWSVRREPGGTIMDPKPAAIVDSSGAMKIDYTKGLAIDVWPDGRIEVRSTEKGLHRLLAGNGDTLIDDRKATFHRLGNWVRTTRRTATGYLTAEKEWALPLEPGTGSPFHGREQRALFENADGARIIDAKGGTIADLPEGDWRWPAGTHWLTGYDAQQDVTRYADIDGKESLVADGRLGPFRDGIALRMDDRGAASEWVGPEGEVVSAGRYRDLGYPEADELAYAAGPEGLYGYIDREGRFAVPPVYRHVSAFDEGRAIVTTGYNAMMIDADGRPRARVNEECGVRVLYGAGNDRLWPERMPSRCR